MDRTTIMFVLCIYKDSKIEICLIIGEIFMLLPNMIQSQNIDMYIFCGHLLRYNIFLASIDRLQELQQPCTTGWRQTIRKYHEEEAC